MDAEQDLSLIGPVIHGIHHSPADRECFDFILQFQIVGSDPEKERRTAECEVDFYFLRRVEEIRIEFPV